MLPRRTPLTSPSGSKKGTGLTEEESLEYVNHVPGRTEMFFVIPICGWNEPPWLNPSNAASSRCATSASERATLSANTQLEALLYYRSDAAPWR